MVAIEFWLITLSIIGLVISAYITISRARNKKVICPINSRSCNAVLDSKWSNILGIRNEILGVIYYVAIIVGVMLITNGYSALTIVMKAATTISALYSIILMLIQTRLLKEFCFYCFLTAIINIAIFILLVK